MVLIGWGRSQSIGQNKTRNALVRASAWAGALGGCARAHLRLLPERRACEAAARAGAGVSTDAPRPALTVLSCAGSRQVGLCPGPCRAPPSGDPIRVDGFVFPSPSLLDGVLRGGGRASRLHVVYRQACFSCEVTETRRQIPLPQILWGPRRV